MHLQPRTALSALSTEVDVYRLQAGEPNLILNSLAETGFKSRWHAEI